MNAEILHDAISLLPEDMLADVDHLRLKRRAPWKGFVAVAACFCLLAGAWMLQNSGTRNKSGSTAPEGFMCDDAGMGKNNAYSQESALIATVVEVQEDRIVVLPTEATQTITVMLTDLENIPKLAENQRIHIYYSEKTDPLIPYQIEIINE